MDDLVEIRVRAALLVLGDAPADSPLRVSESHDRVRPRIKLMTTFKRTTAARDDADIAAAIARNMIWGAPWPLSA